MMITRAQPRPGLRSLLIDGYRTHRQWFTWGGPAGHGRLDEGAGRFNHAHGGSGAATMFH
jgi:hypothetical protein